jgi:hypothetical protein
MDPQGGMLGAGFPATRGPPRPGAMEQGQPVPGAALPAGSSGVGSSANPSVDALRSGNPLATGNAGFAQGGLGHVGTDPLQGGPGPQGGAGAPSPPGAGMPAYGPLMRGV